MQQFVKPTRFCVRQVPRLWRDAERRKKRRMSGQHHYYELARSLRARSHFVSDYLQANEMLRVADQLENMAYRAHAARNAPSASVLQSPHAFLI